jgi:dienelactone hydrolase
MRPLQPARFRALCPVALALLLTGMAQGTRAAAIQTLTARPALPGGRRAPLCILLPGGPGRMPQATKVMDTMGNALAERGWLVVVPVSPDGKSFLGEAADQVVLLMNQWAADPDVRPGKVLLAGVSNGGIAALQIAGMVPDRVSGVIAVPGLLNPWTKVGHLQHLPVYLRIGAEDALGWNEHYEDLVRKLGRAGVRLDAELLEGAGHQIPIDWEEIDAWTGRALGALGPPGKTTARILLPSSAAELRGWTSRHGETVTAALSEISGGDVILVRPGGGKLRIKKEDLSAEDQGFLEALTQAADGRRP